MIKYIRREGDIMPPFYLGLAYRDDMAYREIYFIMPLNYLIRWKRFIHHWWMRNIQHRFSWFDKEVKKIRQQMRDEYRDEIVRAVNESDRYREAYYECMRVIIKSNVSRETIGKLHRL